MEQILENSMAYGKLYPFSDTQAFFARLKHLPKYSIHICAPHSFTKIGSREYKKKSSFLNIFSQKTLVLPLNILKSDTKHAK